MAVTVGGMVRLGVPIVVLAVLVQHLGTEPFARAVDRITPTSVLLAVLVTAATTWCAAARWAWVARRLGLGLGLRRAVAAYYRSQLLNQTLPGGVLGDVERAALHGHEQAALGGAARAVVWERVLGQVGLIVLTLAVVAALPSALRDRLAWGVPSTVIAGVLLVGVALAGAGLLRRWRGIAGRTPATLVADVQRLTSGGAPWVPLLLSITAASGHLVVLLVALRTAQVDVPLSRAVPLLAIVLVASSLPTSIAGWGPREGAAAWVFGAAGLGAADGLTVAVLYGILSLAATAPGLVVLAHGALPRPIEASAS
jgi:uncharacterized membrane protein YbhN (UPF0104 family)